VAGETVALLEADPAVEVQILPLEVEETSLPSRDRQSGQRIVTVLEVASVCGWIVCAKNWQLGGTASRDVRMKLLRSTAHGPAASRHDTRAPTPGRHLQPFLSQPRLSIPGRRGLGESPRQWPSQWRQLLCIACHRYFLETLGTIFHGKRTFVELIVRVLACLAEGLGIRGTTFPLHHRLHLI
jgi:hypothetical protein